MQTVTFKAPPALVAKLDKMAKKLDRPKGYLLRKAMQEWLEDTEDYLIAMRRLKTHDPSKAIPYEMIRQKHGLDD